MRALTHAARSLVIFALTAETATAQTRCDDSVAAITDAYCYARALIASLERAHRGALTPDTTTLNRSAVEAAAEVMYISRMKERAVREASDVVASYARSEVEEIRTSAEAMLGAYELLAEIDSALRASLREQLDNEAGAATGRGAEQMADYRFKRRLAAEAMMAAVGTAAEALVERVPNGKLTRLRITRAQRDALLARLRTSFGGALVAAKNGQFASDFAAAASLFRRFLADPGWGFTTRDPKP